MDLEIMSGPEPESVEELRQFRKISLALGYRIFASQRWGDLGDGHISARDPERTDCFWLLTRGTSFHRASVSQLVLVGPGGELVEGNGRINMAAYYIHHPLLMARPDVISAAHVHTGWGTPFAAEVRPIEAISQESCLFHKDHSIFDDEEVQIQDVDGGKRIAEKLGPYRSVILRNHGLLTVAPRVDEAVGCFVQMERVAEVQMKARNPKPISNEAALYAKSDLVRININRVGFWHLVDRYLDDPASVLD